MEMKDLLVHLSCSKHSRSRLEIAVRLAKAFDARLTGLYTSAEGDIPFFMMEEIASTFEPTIRAWWMRMRGKAKSEFDASMLNTGVVSKWIEVNNSIDSMVPYYARYTDLTIVGQIDPGEVLPHYEYKIPERAALESGGPVLIVPYAGTFPTLGERALVAWNGSAQSARALKDALPLLQRAKAVTILTVNSGAVRKSEDNEPGAQIVPYLSRHGIKADTRQLAAADIAVGDMILSQASDTAADLIVMGAYGHSRASEIILGGATHALLDRMTVPVLMSH